MIIFHISFKHLFRLCGVLMGLVCLIHIYLTLATVWQTGFHGSFAFPRSHSCKALYFFNDTRPSPNRSIEELDKIEIRVSVKVGDSGSLWCSDVSYTPPSPEDLTESFTWQTIAPDLKYFLFSAYYEWRTDPPAVRIIGILGEKVDGKFCQLWYANKTLPEIVEAKARMLPESRRKRFSAVFFLCYLPHHLQVPYAVSIVQDACQPPLNILKIMNNQPSASYEVNFTVCISPLNFHFDNYDQLVEIIEVNRIFGAERFVLYNHTTGFNVDRYLRSYEADGIVSIIPWKIPVIVDVWPPDPQINPEIHYFGQRAALNDCLYRNMLRSRFVVFTDLDEVIVPRSHDTWFDMIVRVTDDWSKTSSLLNGQEMFPGSYLVQNTFFRRDWDDVRLEEGEVHGEQSMKLMTLRKLNREKLVHTWYVRSKYIVWSKMAVDVSVHSVFEYIDVFSVTAVCAERNHALLHHYRSWNDSQDMGLAGIMDDRMRDFTEKIVASVMQRHRVVSQVMA